MNKIFKVIWNHSTQSWVATSELTKSHGKTKSVAAAVTAAVAMLSATAAHAAYSDPNHPDVAYSAVGAGANAVKDIVFNPNSGAHGRGEEQSTMSNSVTGVENEYAKDSITQFTNVSVVGNRNIFKSGNPHAFGYDKVTVIGSNNNLNGVDGAAWLDAADRFMRQVFIVGDENSLQQGTNHTVVGRANILRNGSANDVVLGDENDVNDNKDQVVVGLKNVFTNGNTNVTVLGRGNRIGAVASLQYPNLFGEDRKGGVSNSVVVGQGNTMGRGKDMVMVGLNLTVRNPTNVTYGNFNVFGANISMVSGLQDGTVIGRNITWLGENRNRYGQADTTPTTAGGVTLPLHQHEGAGGDNVIAIGSNISNLYSATKLSNNIVVGQDSRVGGSSSLVIGHQAYAHTTQSIAMGFNAATYDDRGVAIGKDATAVQVDGIAIGTNAGALYWAGYDNREFGSRGRKEGSIAVGKDATILGFHSVAIGLGATVGDKDVVGIGRQAALAAMTPEDRAAAIATLKEKHKDAIEGSVAIGANVSAQGWRDIAIGHKTETANSTRAKEKLTRSVAIGDEAATGAKLAVAMGHKAFAYANESIAIGTQAQAGKAVGEVSNGTRSIAIGFQAKALGNQSISIGDRNTVKGDKSGALGDPSYVDGEGTYTIGNDNGTQAKPIAANQAGAFGNNNAMNASGEGSRIVGNRNTVNVSNTFVMGNNVTATQANSVVLGESSTDRDATTEASGTVKGITYGDFAGQGAVDKGVVSVGKQDGERQIINVASGKIAANSTDAINGSQLYLVTDRLGNVAATTANHLGGGVTVGADGNLTAPVYNVVKGSEAPKTAGDSTTNFNAAPYNNVGAAIAGLNTYVNQGFNVTDNDNTVKGVVTPTETVNFHHGVGTESNVTTEANGITKVTFDVKYDENSLEINGDGKLAVKASGGGGWKLREDTDANTAKHDVRPNAIVTFQGKENSFISTSISANNGNPVVSIDLQKTDTPTAAASGELLDPAKNPKKRGGVVTSTELVEAVNNSGWRVTVDKKAGTSGSATAYTEEAIIRPGNMVEFIAGNGIDLVQGELDGTYPTGGGNKVGQKIVISAKVPETTTVGVNEATGVVTDVAAADQNKPVTAGSVATALQNLGFKLKASAEAGKGEKLAGSAKADGEMINTSDEVEMIAGKNMTVKHDTEGKITYATKDDVEFNSVQLGNTQTGPKLTADGDKIKVSKQDGTTAAPITNIDSGLQNYAEQNTPKAGLRDLTNNTAAPDSNAATVGDLRNLGWIVSSDKTTGATEGAADATEYSKAVKNANEVKFVGTGSALVSAKNVNGVNVVTIHGDLPQSTDLTVSTGADEAANKNEQDVLQPNGKVVTPTAENGSKVVNASTVANAINNSGFIVGKNADTTGVTFNDVDEKVSPGDELRFADGKGTKVKVGTKTEDGKSITTVKVDVAEAAVEYTDAAGNKVAKAADGNFYPVDADGNPQTTQPAVSNPIASVINPAAAAGKAGDATTLGNIAGNLDGAKKDTTAPTTKVEAPQNLNNNNAATVGDVLNAGWNLQENGAEKDFVRHADTVNFVNGTGTTVTVTPKTDGTLNEIRVDTVMQYTDKDGNPVVKAADGNFYKPADIVNGAPKQGAAPVDAPRVNLVDAKPGTAPVLGNIGSSLTKAPITANSGSQPAADAATNPAAPKTPGTETPVDLINLKAQNIDPNTAVTVGDLQNYGWVIEAENNDYRQAVKNAQELNIRGTGGVKVEGKTEGDKYVLEVGLSDAGSLQAEEAKKNPSDADATPTGKIAVAANPAGFVNAQNIADAINKSGFNLKATAGDGGERVAAGTVAKDELINPGDTVNMIAGKNLSVKHDTDGNITYATKEDVKFTSVTVGEPTNTNAPKLTSNTDGDLVLNGAPSNPAEPNSAPKPVKVKNVDSGLSNYPAPTDPAAKKDPKSDLRNLEDAAAAPDSNAATVGDLRNLGWIVSAKDNAYSDSVKNANEVRFEGKGLAKVTGETDANGVRVITVDVTTGEVVKSNEGVATVNGAPVNVVKVGDQYFNKADIDPTTGKQKPNTTPVTPDAGTTVENKGAGLVNGNQVADAIQASGWTVGKATADEVAKTTFDNQTEKVNPNDNVRFADGANTKVSLGTVESLDENGTKVTTTTVKVDVVDLPVAFTDAAGNKVAKADDGKFYPVNDKGFPDTTKAPVDAPVVNVVNPANSSANNVGAPVSFGNIKGLDTYTTGDVAGLTDLNDATDDNGDLVPSVASKAATVGDLANMGWVVGTPENGYTDQIRNANKVNFIGSGVATVQGTTTDDGAANVVVHVDADDVARNVAGSVTAEGNKAVDKTEPTDFEVIVNGAPVNTVKVGDKFYNKNDIDPTTGEPAPNAQPVTPDAGTQVTDITAPRFATTKDVAYAINNSGFTLKTSAVAGGKKESGVDEVINPADTVEMVAGKNLTVKQEADGKVTYATAENVSFTSIQLGDANGPKLSNQGGDIKVGDKDGNKVGITNLEGNLDGAKTNTTAPTTKGEAPTNVNNSNAATVGDVLNAGFNLQGNGTASDFVKPYDTVNFVNGAGTTASVTTDAEGKSTNIKFDVKVDNTGAGTNVTVGADGLKVDVKTTDLTPETVGQGTNTVNTGRVASPAQGDHLVNATTVANAINNSGFVATIGSDNTEFNNQAGKADALIQPGKKVQMNAGKNLRVKQNVTAQGTEVTYALENNVDLGSNGSINVAGAGIDAQGINAGNKTIRNVAPGVKPTDGVNVSQLQGTANYLNNKINRQGKDLRAGIAGANAAAGLPQVYIPGKSMVAASAGTYKGQSAVAVGYSRASDNGKLILKLQGNANTRGDVGGSVGVGYQW